MKAEGWTDDLVKQTLKGLFDADPEVSDLQRAYHEAAAVLACFDLDSIRPVGWAASDERPPIGDLAADCELIDSVPGEPQWLLTRMIRRKVLEQLLTEQRIQQALDANPDRANTVRQKMLEGYLLFTALPLSEQSLPELTTTLQIVDWLDGLNVELPKLEHVQQRIERANLLSTFRQLADEHFAGRQDELGIMNSYVGVLQTRLIERIFSIRDKPPLFIFGPGGIGKSSLIAKFILNHAELDQAQRFPFVYLDFDRPGLLAEEPITLLRDALRQLAAQYPDAKERYEQVQREWNRQMSDRSFWEEQSKLPTRSGFRLKNRDWYFESFSDFVNQLKVQDQPLLLVLDTFEEVQLRSRAFVEEIYSFLDTLVQYVPRLRSVLSGRVPAYVQSCKLQELELKLFDREAAQAFLMRQGIHDPQVVATLAARVEGSPLALKLAAELVLKDPAALEEIRRLNVSWFDKLRGVTVSGQLYARILQHIRDKEVRKLAHPGLVLRRITPELILQVLAKPCDVMVADIGQAVALFAKLRREVTLVMPFGDDVLIHRRDLRRIMLADLQASKPDQVREIHESAIRYYTARADDSAALAEELYHRLSLGLERATIDARFPTQADAIDRLRGQLGESIRELPPTSQAYLAARLVIEIDDAIWDSAEQEDWELYAARLARESLSVAKLEEALTAVRRRSSRLQASELYALEVDALAQLGKIDEAVQIAQRGIASLPVSKAPLTAQQAALIDRLNEQIRLIAPAPAQSMGDTLSPTSVKKPLRLTAKQMRQLQEAFIDAFTLNDFREMLRSGLNLNLALITLSDNLADAAVAVITYANARGMVNALVLAARQAKPGNSRLFAVAQELGLTSLQLTNAQLKEMLARTGSRIDTHTFRSRLAQLEAQICRIEPQGAGRGISGTGILIGPDLVLTSYRVVEGLIFERAAPSALSLQFDRNTSGGGTLFKGTVYPLAAEWLIDASPASDNAIPSLEQLDYALLRLERRPAKQPFAESPRGWVDISAPAALPSSGAPLFMLEYTREGTVNFASDTQVVLGLNETGSRLQYTSAVVSSAGALCLDANLMPVALHSDAVGNSDSLFRLLRSQGIPFTAIAARLRQRRLLPDSE